MSNRFRSAPTQNAHPLSKNRRLANWGSVADLARASRPLSPGHPARAFTRAGLPPWWSPPILPRTWCAPNESFPAARPRRAEGLRPSVGAPFYFALVEATPPRGGVIAALILDTQNADNRSGEVSGALRGGDGPALGILPACSRGRSAPVWSGDVWGRSAGIPPAVAWASCPCPSMAKMAMATGVPPVNTHVAERPCHDNCSTRRNSHRDRGTRLRILRSPSPGFP